MPEWDLLLTDARVATLRGGGYGIIDEPAAIAMSDGVIDWVGPMTDLPARSAKARRALDGRWVTPALIDCHTHIVFAGDRAAEFEQRLQGKRYEDIARAGGGILSTVKATRAASEDELAALAVPRAKALAAEGVATLEIKSGYGLNVEDELKMLRAARRVGEETGLSVVTTLLAAHTVPPEYDADRYIDLIVSELLPRVVEEKLADAVDAYCEPIAFSAAHVRCLFESCREHDLPVRLHADQLSDSGGAELAAEFNALSADHLEYTTEAGVRAMARSGVAAVLLPGAYLTLGETQSPPVQSLREHGVPIAVASDCNPGTSPICSLRTSMMLASRLFKLTPEECLAGVTHNAALALGLDDRGSLVPGKRGDIAIWDIGHPRELAYWTGTPQIYPLLSAGETRTLRA